MSNPIIESDVFTCLHTLQLLKMGSTLMYESPSMSGMVWAIETGYFDDSKLMVIATNLMTLNNLACKVCCLHRHLNKHLVGLSYDVNYLLRCKINHISIAEFLNFENTCIICI